MNNWSRFDNKAVHYAAFRPRYPAFLFSFLEEQLSLKPNMVLADIGAGTGLFSLYFLEKGFEVYCVEPNPDMRNAAQQLLSKFPGARILNGSAEQTGITANKVDVAFVAQAFHWMDAARTKTELNRILVPGGRIAIFWILPDREFPFVNQLEQLRKKFAITDIPGVRNDEGKLSEFFSPAQMKKYIFKYDTMLSFDMIKGWLLSVSFLPDENHEIFPLFISEVKTLFDRFREGDVVRYHYELPVYWK